MTPYTNAHRLFVYLFARLVTRSSFTTAKIGRDHLLDIPERGSSLPSPANALPDSFLELQYVTVLLLQPNLLDFDVFSNVSKWETFL